MIAKATTAVMMAELMPIMIRVKRERPASLSHGYDGDPP